MRKLALLVVFIFLTGLISVKAAPPQKWGSCSSESKALVKANSSGLNSYWSILNGKLHPSIRVVVDMKGTWDVNDDVSEWKIFNEMLLEKRPFKDQAVFYMYLASQSWDREDYEGKPYPRAANFSKGDQIFLNATTDIGVVCIEVIIG